jgi:radical SAM protein with 4Fe4S-binding SPASM domain
MTSLTEDCDFALAQTGNKKSQSTDRLTRLGVDLDRYPSVTNRQTFEPMNTRKNRELTIPIAKGLFQQWLKQTPDPIMLTHIVTTRCNYSCGFCSFADTLNNKTNELSLDEIEQTYASIGKNLNVIVYSGGETTLNKDLPQIIEAAYRLTPVKSVYIISNAWKPNLILDITHQVMQRCPQLHLTWSLSIEGSKPVNNSVRYTQASHWDAWQNTVDTMEALKAIRENYGYKQLDVQLCTVCSPANAHLLQDWYQTIKGELLPDKWNLNLMRKSVQMSENELASFSERRHQKQLALFESQYLAITEQVRRDVLSGDLKFLYHSDIPGDGAMKSAVDLISQEENRRTLQEEPLLFACKAGSMGAYISSNGMVSACEEFAHNPKQPKVFGNLRDYQYNFRAIWHSQSAQAYRKNVGKSPECHGCTLESQRNYPSILLSPKTLLQARQLAKSIH